MKHARATIGPNTFGTHTLRAALAALTLAGCAASVGGADGGTSDAATRDGATASDASAPGTCPGGRRVGESFPAPDGCNTCTCLAGGAVSCTERGCVEPGPIPCRRSDECPNGTMCRGPEGCGVAWSCQPLAPCTEDLVMYCTCDGRTVQGSGSCPPEPYRSRGSCGLSMLVDCDARRALCFAVEPRCPPGQLASVLGDCWGPCVSVCACAPTRCGSDADCRAGFTCDGGACRARSGDCP